MAQSMYDQAKYYDLIYSWKDYKKESQKIISLISKYKKSKGNVLLEVGCGTGKHAQYLCKKFECTGIDLSEEMLKIAKKRVPRAKFVKANMINFDLGRRFDAIVCLFSAIGYVKTYGNLRKTMENFSKHLNTGGVVIIEPWFTKKEYGVGTVHMSTYQDDNTKIARLNISKAKDGVSIMDMHHLIAEKGKGVRYFVSREELGMFDPAKVLAIMEKAGIRAQFVKGASWDKRRGLFIGLKKTE